MNKFCSKRIVGKSDSFVSQQSKSYTVHLEKVTALMFISWGTYHIFSTPRTGFNSNYNKLRKIKFKQMSTRGVHKK